MSAKWRPFRFGLNVLKKKIQDGVNYIKSQIFIDIYTHTNNKIKLRIWTLYLMLINPD